MDSINIPLTEVNGEKWLLLNQLDKKIVFRAFNIEKPRRVSEPNQHRIFEAVAEGGVKCRPKRYTISDDI